MARPARIDVFRYLDYRTYLRALYEDGRARGLGYRAFSKRADCGLSDEAILDLALPGWDEPTMCEEGAVC